MKRPSFFSASFGACLFLIAVSVIGAASYVLASKPPAPKRVALEPYKPKPAGYWDINRRDSDGGMGASAGAVQQ